MGPFPGGSGSSVDFEDIINPLAINQHYRAANEFLGGGTGGGGALPAMDAPQHTFRIPRPAPQNPQFLPQAAPAPAPAPAPAGGGGGGPIWDQILARMGGRMGGGGASPAPTNIAPFPDRGPRPMTQRY